MSGYRRRPGVRRHAAGDRARALANQVTSGVRRLGLLLAVLVVNLTVGSSTARTADRVTICHKPGTSAQKTMVLPVPAMRGHLNHGDTLGKCGGGPPPPPPPPPTTVLCGGETATIVGTAGDDSLTGTEGPDVIAGLAGNDTILGLGGDDLICGGAGANTVNGGDGFDTCLEAEPSIACEESVLTLRGAALDNLTVDTDGDGIFDSREAELGTDPASAIAMGTWASTRRGRRPTRTATGCPMPSSPRSAPRSAIPTPTPMAGATPTSG
jgi:hypothetical protein